MPFSFYRFVKWFSTVIIILLIIAVPGLWYLNSETLHYYPGKVSAPQAFEEVPPSFSHVWQEPSHPFTGASVIDVNGDGVSELFIGGGLGQADGLLAFRDGALVDLGFGVSNADEKPATHGSASIDIDDDGDVDLLVTREDGLYLHLNNGGKFDVTKIPLRLSEDATPLSVSVSDIDGDGDGDIYVSVFVSYEAFRSGVLNDPDHAKTNIMLRNDGDFQFTDVTDETGTKGKQNTFHSHLQIWIRMAIRI